jgi:hypothetical protein
MAGNENLIVADKIRFDDPRLADFTSAAESPNNISISSLSDQPMPA